MAGYLLGTPAWHATANQPSGPLSFLPSGDGTDALRLLAVMALAIPVAGTVILALERRLELFLYSIVVLAPGLLWANWMSVPRYCLMALPAYLAIAARLPRRWIAVVLGLSAAGQVFFAVLAVQRYVRGAARAVGGRRLP